MFSRGKKLVELQEIHQADVLVALSYIKRLSDIDHSRIAMIGCSFGGIQTVLAIEKQLGLRAANSQSESRRHRICSGCNELG